MTDKEAMFLLGASRPGDARDPEFAEALAQASRDPALKAWLDDQRRFDAAVAARLQAAPVPADLRSRILTGGKVSRPASWFSMRAPYAIAAMIAILMGLAALYLVNSDLVRHHNQWQDSAIAALSQLLSGQEKFDAQSPNVADLEQWLRANGSPSGAAGIPASIQRLASVGCKTLEWHGHPISIICFHGPGGELVHLAMIDRSALKNPPPDGYPVFEARDGWSMACWSQGDTSMMLATRASESQLHALLGIILLF